MRCVFCGESDGKAHWSDTKRLHVIRRCRECGGNARGAGQWLPKQWAEHSAIGLVLSVDPHLEHRHGHAPCDHIDQGELPW